MALNGSGIYSLPSPQNPAVTGELITAAAFNITMLDIATALSTALYKDGQSAMAADLSMGGHKLTNLADGVAAQDAATVAQLAAVAGGGTVASAEFPATTAMAFWQASAPTGWTKSTAHNDKALRVVSGTGGGSGGTHDLSTVTDTAHTHTFATVDHTHTMSASAHTHTITHLHHIMKPTNGTSGFYYDTYHNSSGTEVNFAFQTVTTGVHMALTGSGYGPALDMYTGPTLTASSGSGGGISGNTGSAGAATSSNTGSSSPTTFAPKYIDVIIAVKD